MRPPKEIIVLFTLLLLAMASVVWYVIDRRAKMATATPAAQTFEKASPHTDQTTAVASTTLTDPTTSAPPVSSTAAPTSAPSTPVATAATAAPASPPASDSVDLTKTDGQTVDFSSGHPVVKQSAKDKAALDAGLKDIADATKGVTFGPPPKPADPAPSKP